MILSEMAMEDTTVVTPDNVYKINYISNRAGNPNPKRINLWARIKIGNRQFGWV